ncbi:MAG: hypothetical protein ACTSYU_10660, partial [Promethearchaeota archaeon]
SVGIFFLGIYLLDLVGTSLEAENTIIGVIFGGVAITGINIGLLSLPLIKFSKKYINLKSTQPLSDHRVAPNSWKKWFKPRISDAQPYLIDPSPLLTLVACIMGFLVYAIFASLDEITTLGGQLVMILLVLACIGLLIFVYWLFPFVLLREVKKRSLQVNYVFED